MTPEQLKAYNAENFPASVLKWLNEATDRVLDSQTCEGCKYEPTKDEVYPTECGQCSRFYGDGYEIRV